MDKIIKQKLSNVLKQEAEYIMNHEEKIDERVNKMNTIFNLQKILDNYDGLESVLRDFFEKKAQKEKWERNK